MPALQNNATNMVSAASRPASCISATGSRAAVTRDLRRARGLRTAGPFLEPVSRVSLGYDLVDLSKTKMTEADMRSLFDEMDEIADELGWNPSEHRDALRVEFRMLQKLRQPQPTLAQSEDLFTVWADRYAGLRDIGEAERRTRIEELAEEQRNLLIAREFAGAGTAGVNERLRRIGVKMAAAITPRPYCGPLGSWGDA